MKSALEVNCSPKPIFIFPVTFAYIVWCRVLFPSELWHCWLGDRKGIWLVKSWVLVCWWWNRHVRSDMAASVCACQSVCLSVSVCLCVYVTMCVVCVVWYRCYVMPRWWLKEWSIVEAGVVTMTLVMELVCSLEYHMNSMLTCSSNSYLLSASCPGLSIACVCLSALVPLLYSVHS